MICVQKYNINCKCYILLRQSLSHDLVLLHFLLSQNLVLRQIFGGIIGNY